VEHEHGVAVDSGLHRPRRLGRRIQCKVDARNLAHEQRMQLAHIDGHGFLRATGLVAQALVPRAQLNSGGAGASKAQFATMIQARKSLPGLPRAWMRAPPTGTAT